MNSLTLDFKGLGLTNLNDLSDLIYYNNLKNLETVSIIVDNNKLKNLDDLRYTFKN